MDSFQNNEIFKKYYKKLVWENVIKSFSYGLTIAAVANFITAFICWFTTDLGLWISLGVFVVVLAITVPCLYFFEFKPTPKDLAKRLDGLGLDERMVSMLEFGNDGTFIGSKIADDAVKSLSLKAASGVGLKICTSALSICLCAAAVIAGGGMTTVAGLAGNGTIPPGSEWGNIINPPAEIYIEVNYIVIGITSDGEQVPDLGGMIEGDDFQLVVDGGNTTPVLAVAEDDWYFVYWDDGTDNTANTDPYRYDTDITGDGHDIGEDGQIVINIFAVFTEFGDGDGSGDGDSNGQPQEGDENGGGEGDSPEDAPPSDSEGDNGNSENNTDPDNQSPSTGASGREDPKNQVIDGKQYYRERYEEYRQKAQEYLDRGEDVPQKLKDIINYYFEMIK